MNRLNINNPLGFLAHRLEYVQLLSLGVHIGHSLKNSVLYASWFIFGFRRDVTVINLFKFINMFRIGLSCFNSPIFLGRAIWFACQEKSFDRYIRALAHRCGEFSSTLYWIRGMLSNYNAITQTFRRLSAMSRLVRSRKEKRYDLNFRTWHLTRFTWPGAVFVSSVQKSYFIVNEALSARVPCLGITDTNAYAQACSVAVPGNDDSIDCIIFYNEIAGAYILYKKFISVFLWFLYVRRGHRLLNFSEWLLSKYDFSRDSISLFFNFHYSPHFRLNLNHTALQFFFYKDSWGSEDFEFLRLEGGSSLSASRLLATFKQGRSRYAYFLAYHFFNLILKKNFPIETYRYRPSIVRILLRLKRFPLFMLERKVFSYILPFNNFAPIFLRNEEKTFFPFFRTFLRLLVTVKFLYKNMPSHMRVFRQLNYNKNKEYFFLHNLAQRRFTRMPPVFGALPTKEVLLKFDKIWHRRLRANKSVTPRDLGVFFSPIVKTLRFRRSRRLRRRALAAFKYFRRLVVFYARRQWSRRQWWWWRSRAKSAAQTVFVNAIAYRLKAKFSKRMFFKEKNTAEKFGTLVKIFKRYSHRIFFFLILGIWRSDPSRLYHTSLSQPKKVFRADLLRQYPLIAPSLNQPIYRKRFKLQPKLVSSSRAFDHLDLLWQGQESRFPIFFLSFHDSMEDEHFWYKLQRNPAFSNWDSFFFKDFFGSYRKEQKWFFLYTKPEISASSTWYLNSTFII